jgi:hypothetical protein
MELLGEAIEGIVVVEHHSTFGGSAGVGIGVRHTCGVGHVQREMRPKMENLIEECGTKSGEGMVASSVWPP